MTELSPAQQVYEIKQEFIDESIKVKNSRSTIERKQAMIHVNALLDAYSDIQLETIPTQVQVATSEEVLKYGD